MIEEFIWAFLEEFSIYAPDGSSVCIEDREEAVGIELTVMCDLPGGIRARKITLTHMLILDEQIGQAAMQGLLQGERLALIACAVYGGHADIEASYAAGVGIKVREWKPGMTTTWYTIIHPEMQLAFYKRKTA